MRGAGRREGAAGGHLCSRRVFCAAVKVALVNSSTTCGCGLPSPSIASAFLLRLPLPGLPAAPGVATSAIVRPCAGRSLRQGAGPRPDRPPLAAGAGGAGGCRWALRRRYAPRCPAELLLLVTPMNRDPFNCPSFVFLCGSPLLLLSLLPLSFHRAERAWAERVDSGTSVPAAGDLARQSSVACR